MRPLIWHQCWSIFGIILCSRAGWQDQEGGQDDHLCMQLRLLNHNIINMYHETFRLTPILTPFSIVGWSIFTMRSRMTGSGRSRGWWSSRWLAKSKINFINCGHISSNILKNHESSFYIVEMRDKKLSQSFAISKSNAPLYTECLQYSCK